MNDKLREYVRAWLHKAESDMKNATQIREFILTRIDIGD